MKKLPRLIFLLLMVTSTLSAAPAYDYSKLQREKLGRGLVAVRSSDTTIAVQWRYLDSDPLDVAFHVYRASVREGDLYERAKIKRTKTAPVSGSTFYIDKVSKSEKGPFAYYVVPVNADGEEGEFGGRFLYRQNYPYLEIPMKAIDGDSKWKYVPSDASVGDLDGDGEYELVIKREPDNGQDNSNSGVTGVTYLEGYEFDGTFLWRINLGKNIRSGAHYTQFMVYDFDADGKAEIICKTADGTIDGLGQRIGTTSNYVNAKGYILSGPEYLTVFGGENGAALKTVNYKPARFPNGSLTENSSLLNSVWGDNYGNRCDRYLAAVAYLDGVHPSVVMCRGYYTRTTLWALQWNGTELKENWYFDTYNNASLKSYEGQGFHSIRVGDIDSDGKDEIVYGSCVIDHNGKALYSTGWGHGDALHLSDIDPDLPGLEVWTCHEDKKHGSKLRRAQSGTQIIGIDSKDDVGRCMMADIDPDNRGCEVWSSRSGGVLSCKGKVITPSTSGVSMNMACWWDGGLNRCLLDGTGITRWNRSGSTTLLSAEGCSSNNSTKSNPCLQADILGDWREEVIWRTSDNKAVRIYVTGIPTAYRFHCFMQEPIYRISVATENVAYNQPTQPGFYFGSDLPVIFTQKEYVAEGAELTINPPFEHALAWCWSTGDSTRKLTLTPSKIGAESATVRLTMNYRGCLFTDSVRVSFPNVAVTAPASPEVTFFPTKMEDRLEYHISSLSEPLACRFYNLSGQLCLTRRLEGSVGSLDVSPLPSGVYFLKWGSGAGQRTQRLIKQ